jgi:small multidrug resistance family-3 protein
MNVTRSIGLFVLAGVCEIGGGWLVWQWLRAAKPVAWGGAGAVILVLYGIIPTLQPAHFGRTYAAYGGFFIALSLLWGWVCDGNAPDRFDVLGAAVALGGVAILMYWPR